MPSDGHNTKLQKQKRKRPFGNRKLWWQLLSVYRFSKSALAIWISNYPQQPYKIKLIICFQWYLLIHLVWPEFLEHFTVYRLLKTDMSHKAWPQGHSLTGIHKSKLITANVTKGFCKWKIKFTNICDLNHPYFTKCINTYLTVQATSTVAPNHNSPPPNIGKEYVTQIDYLSTPALVKRKLKTGWTESSGRLICRAANLE